MAAALNKMLKPTRFDTEPSSPKAAKQPKHWLNVLTKNLERCKRLADAQKDTTFNRLQVLFAWSVLKFMSLLKTARRMMLP